MYVAAYTALLDEFCAGVNDAQSFCSRALMGLGPTLVFSVYIIEELII
jgi:hypothetical protein